MATLAPREEALFLAVVDLYDLLVQQFPQLEVQWKKPSDEPSYDEEEEEDPEVLPCRIPHATYHDATMAQQC